MSRLIVLDTGVLGLLSNPRRTPDVVACERWLRGLLAAGDRVAVPEVADYEVRRELLRAGKISGLRRLDGLVATLPYLPISTPAMRLAAELWATLRRQGTPTADPKALDADVILAAQALDAAPSGGDVVVATANVRHLTRMVPAQRWQDIAAEP